jgi:hypothetical protein
MMSVHLSGWGFLAYKLGPYASTVSSNQNESGDFTEGPQYQTRRKTFHRFLSFYVRTGELLLLADLQSAVPHTKPQNMVRKLSL